MNGKVIHRQTGPSGSHFRIVVPDTPHRNNKHSKSEPHLQNGPRPHKTHKSGPNLQLRTSEKGQQKNNVILFDHMKIKELKNAANLTNSFQNEGHLSSRPRASRSKPKAKEDIRPALKNKDTLSYKELYNYLQQLGYGIEEVKTSIVKNNMPPKSHGNLPNPGSADGGSEKTKQDIQKAESNFSPLSSVLLPQNTIIVNDKGEEVQSLNHESTKIDAETNEFVAFSPILSNDLLQALPRNLGAAKSLAENHETGSFLDVSQVFNNPQFVLGNAESLRAFAEDDSKTFAETSFITVDSMEKDQPKQENPKHNKNESPVHFINTKPKITKTQHEKNPEETHKKERTNTESIPETKTKNSQENKRTNGTGEFKFLSFNSIPSSIIPQIQQELRQQEIREKDQIRQEDIKKEEEQIKEQVKRQQENEDQTKRGNRNFQQDQIQVINNINPSPGFISIPISTDPQPNQKITITHQDLQTTINNFHRLPTKDERLTNEKNHNSFSALATGEGILYFNVIGNPTHKGLYTNLGPLASNEQLKSHEENDGAELTTDVNTEKRFENKEKEAVDNIPLNEAELNDLNFNGNYIFYYKHTLEWLRLAQYF